MTPADLARLFGTTEDDLSAKCHDVIAGLDLRYRVPTKEERDDIILAALKKSDSEQLVAAGAHRIDAWEDGWQENLNDFIASGYDLRSLIPKYHQHHKKGLPVRLDRDFFIPESAEFVYNVTHIFRTWIFKSYVEPYDSVYEFGCGTGHNLAYLATLYPAKKYYGFDWATSSQKIIQLVAEKYGWHIGGKNFNFFHPDTSIRIDPKSIVFTFGALEQVGSNHGAFLQFLLERKPTMCINVEGLNELYDSDNLSDYLALRYHSKRNYLNSYLTELKNLESQGKIVIDKIHYQPFGFHDDPHSYVLWKPRV
jgi:SAM-dependent methyltransferase